MEVYRSQPYQEVSLEYSIPSGLGDGGIPAEYILTDLTDLSVVTGDIEVESGESYTVQVPGLYDNDYRLEIVANGEPLFDETYEVVRRYVNPSEEAPEEESLADYEKYEEIARAIIDSVIPEGFYYTKKIIETTGLGADYLPLWPDAKKLLKVYENNVLVYDSDYPELYPVNFEITKDKSAITVKYAGTFNRSESAPNVIPAAYSDLLDMQFAYRGFVQTYDYIVVVEAGYANIPQDIVRATRLLIEDIACGKLDYYKRYMIYYSTDQFKIRFDDQVFEGTGNLIVDKILSKYAKSIKTVGVL
jgi:hypothetical protein